MVNIFHLYTAVAIMCLNGTVPPEQVLKLITTAVTAILGLLGVTG